MARYFPDFETFRGLAESAEIVPVYRRLLSDHLTPVTAFELLGLDRNHAFLLESVVGNEKIGRYSFIATTPSKVYQVKDHEATLDEWPDRREHHPYTPRGFHTEDPQADLQKLIGRRRYHRSADLPAFTGGLVGYAGYDLIRYYEGEKLNQAPKDDRGLPDLLFGLYHILVIFDHVDKTIKVVANASVEGKTAQKAYMDACMAIDELVDRLERGLRTQPPLADIDTTAAMHLGFEANMSRQQYEAAVEAGKEYIRAGDIFQFVPSMRLRVTSSANPFNVYRALRVINPSPFMFYLKTPACTLIGASPEILCRVQDGVVTTRPLAGTRRRGTSDVEDKALEQELLADPKERAEHIMLVDLHRNDIGRVSKIGSVKVSDTMTVERYSHVMHITTNVTGQLDEPYAALDALRVSLPVGTVSGAPKIRAMQIIDELEPTRRGPYGGAVGYVDFAGNMDTCIALRTMVCRDGTYDVQAGAGVVADSVPASEYEESMNKAKALLKAVEIAQRGFGK